MKKSCFLALALCAWAASGISAQITGNFTMTATPTFNIPFGPTLSGSSDTLLYGYGYGASLRGEFAMPFHRPLSGGIVVDADFAPVKESTKTASFLGASGEIAYKLFPIQRLGLRAGVRGGFYHAMLAAESFTQPYMAGSFDIDYLINPTISFGLGASYKAYFPLGEIYSGLGLNLGILVHLGASKGGVKVVPSIQPIFPLFYSYYDKNPVGSIELRNASTSELKDLSVSFFVRQFMEQPKDCWSAEGLAAGAAKTVPAYALFKDSIFGVTEGTKVAGEVIVSYSYLGREVKESFPVTVVVNNRNGMTWDDTRKAAAFVTSMDPGVRSFALPIAAMARTRGSQAVSTNFRIAMAVFDALKIHGIGYVSDPAAPFETKAANKEAVDYLQFPVQTLTYRGGDCDDLSILYAALLESAGIGTAFLTIPGHIYVAFDLGMGVQEAKGFFRDSASLISREGEAWLQVEVTRVQDGFLKAYQTGIQEWASAASKDEAAFFPIREAWQQYAPANTGSLVKDIPAAPDAKIAGEAYDAELQRFYIAEYKPRIDAVQAEIAKGGEVSKLRNRLGVLYARFGMMAEAKREFDFVAGVKGQGGAILASALINLGNISYLGSKYAEAFDYYGRALAITPDSAVATLGYMRAGFELGKAAETNAAMKTLRTLDPPSAAKYAYMGDEGYSLGRAASAEKEITSWSDEE
jgi:tetratricopeptide (TPR) repeat protein